MRNHRRAIIIGLSVTIAVVALLVGGVYAAAWQRQKQAIGLCQEGVRAVSILKHAMLEQLQRDGVNEALHSPYADFNARNQQRIDAVQEQINAFATNSNSSTNSATSASADAAQCERISLLSVFQESPIQPLSQQDADAVKREANTMREDAQALVKDYAAYQAQRAKALDALKAKLAEAQTMVSHNPASLTAALTNAVNAAQQVLKSPSSGVDALQSSVQSLQEQETQLSYAVTSIGREQMLAHERDAMRAAQDKAK